MNARIMVVDDEAVTGRLLLYQLQSLGYQVTYLQDGLQALQRVLIEQPDLILLDVMMPQISGWEVCREVRECSSVPIIMLTAKDSDDDVVAGLAAGADDYVTKPFNMAQLHARIEAVLRRAGQGVPRRAPPESPAPPPRQAPSASLRPAAGFVRPAAPAPAPAEPRGVTASAARVAAAPAMAVAAARPAEPPATAPPPAPDYDQRLGTRLRAARQSRGLSLYQAERLCRVRWDYLQALEQENWDYMPRPHLRPTLYAYAALLRIDLGQPQPRPAAALLESPYVQYAALALVAVLLLISAYLVVGAALR